MNKIWLVIKYEYLKHVKKKRFILALLSLPFFVLVTIGIGYLSVFMQYNNKPVGFIDNLGLINDSVEYQSKPPLKIMKPYKFVRFQNEEEARKRVIDEEIQAVYILDQDYLKNNEVRLIANKLPDPSLNRDFTEFLQTNLFSELPEDVGNRLNQGSEFKVITIKGAEETPKDNPFIMVLPMFVAIIFVIAVNVTGGYLLQAVVDEKENRTMEIMVTSLSPMQLMAGKVIGNLSVGLTQILVWLVFGAIAAIIALRSFIADAGKLIEPSILLPTILVFLASFISIAGLMATLGATSTEAKEAQQASIFFTLPMFIPLWFIQLLIDNPNSPISIFMSMFPLTSPVALPIRMSIAAVPEWQIIITIVIAYLFAFSSIWFAAKAFRLGMLRYGKKLTFKEIFRTFG